MKLKFGIAITLIFILAFLIKYLSRPTEAAQIVSLSEATNLIGMTSDRNIALLEKQYEGTLQVFSLKKRAVSPMKIPAGWKPFQPDPNLPFNPCDPHNIDYVVVGKGRNFKLLKISEKPYLVDLVSNANYRISDVKKSLYKQFAVLSFSKYLLVFRGKKPYRIEKSASLGSEECLDVKGDILMILYDHGIELFNTRTRKRIYQQSLPDSWVSGRISSDSVIWILNDKNALYELNIAGGKLTLLRDMGGGYHKFSESGLYSIGYTYGPDLSDNTSGSVVLEHTSNGKVIHKLQAKVGAIADVLLMGNKLLVTCNSRQTGNPILVIVDVPSRESLTK